MHGVDRQVVAPTSVTAAAAARLRRMHECAVLHRERAIAKGRELLRHSSSVQRLWHLAASAAAALAGSKVLLDSHHISAELTECLQELHRRIVVEAVTVELAPIQTL